MDEDTQLQLTGQKSKQATPKTKVSSLSYGERMFQRQIDQSVTEKKSLIKGMELKDLTPVRPWSECLIMLPWKTYSRHRLSF